MGHEEVTKYLLVASFGINTTGDYLLVAAAVVSRRRWIPLVEMLIAEVEKKAGKKLPPALRSALLDGHRSIGPQIRWKSRDNDWEADEDDWGTNEVACDHPLIQAVHCDDEEFTRYFLDFGADVNATCTRQLDQVTPLYAASEDGNENLVELLIKAYADTNWKSSPGGTPLTVAALKGYDKIVSLLQGSGADVNARDLYPEETTALQLASAAGHSGVVKLLLDAGADTELCDLDDGKTALDMARKSRRSKVVRLLEARTTPARVKKKGGAGGNASAYEFEELRISSARKVSHFGVIRSFLSQYSCVHCNEQPASRK